MIFFVLTWEQRIADIKFVKNTPKRPHINSGCISDSKYDFRRPVESTLDIGVNLLVFKTARSKINNFDSRLVYFSKEDVFWFEIAMDYLVFVKVVKRNENLYRKPLDQIQREPLEIIHLYELVQIY